MMYTRICSARLLTLDLNDTKMRFANAPEYSLAGKQAFRKCVGIFHGWETSVPQIRQDVS